MNFTDSPFEKMMKQVPQPPRPVLPAGIAPIGRAWPVWVHATGIYPSRGGGRELRANLARSWPYDGKPRTDPRRTRRNPQAGNGHVREL